MRALVPQFGEGRVEFCQFSQPLGRRMGLQLKHRILFRPENRDAMAMGSMNPLNRVRCRQNRAGERGFAFAHPDAVASKDDKTLCKSAVSQSVVGCLRSSLTSPCGVETTNRPPVFLWRLFLSGLKEECWRISIPPGSG